MTKKKRKTAVRKGNFKRRVAIGLILIAAAVALGFALSWMIGSDSPVWRRVIYVVAVFGTGMGGFLYIFAGWPGIAAGFAFPIFIALKELLPRPWSVLVYLAGIALLCALPKILQARKRTEEMQAVQSTASDGSEPAAKTFALRPVNGCIYQLIKTGGELRAYCVGDNVRGLTFEKIVDDGNALRPKGKRDVFIKEDEVTKLRFETPENTMYSLRVKLRAAEKTYNFVPFGDSDDELLNFLRDFAVEAQSDPDKRLAQDGEGTEINSRRAGILHKILIALMCLAAAAQISWLFLDVPYELFAALSLLPTPAVLLLYLLFPNELSVSENRVRKGKRISVISMLMGPSFAPIMRTILDFNFLDWPRLWMISGALFLTLMAAVLILSREWRAKPSLLIGIVFALALYLPALTGQANVLLDFADPEVAGGTVIDMDIHRNSRAPDRYELILKVGSDEALGLNVAKAQYDDTNIGDYVYVLTFPGRLGIPYAEMYAGIASSLADSHSASEISPNI